MTCTKVCGFGGEEVHEKTTKPSTLRVPGILVLRRRGLGLPRLQPAGARHLGPKMGNRLFGRQTEFYGIASSRYFRLNLDDSDRCHGHWGQRKIYQSRVS